MAMKFDRKSILLGSLLILCVAATVSTRNVLTTTSIDRVALTSLGTNILAQSTAAGTRTLLNVTNATGTEALLSGTNVFTGTNTFTAAKIVGAVQVFHLTTSALSITNLGTNFATSNNSNMWSMPALIASNAHLKITHNASRTSTTTAGGSMGTEGRFFIGNDAASATNLIYYPNLITGAGLRGNTVGADFSSVWDSTNALVSTSVAGGGVAYSITNTNTACTNVNFSLPWVVVLKVNDLSAISTGTNVLTLHYLSIQAEQ